MEDNNLIYALINICNSWNNTEENLYILFSDIWAKNFDLKRKYEERLLSLQSSSLKFKEQQKKIAPPKNYEVEISWDDKYDSDCLLVICSHKHNYAFYKYPFGFNKLFICDKEDSYFTLYAGRLTDYIKSVVIEKLIKKVCFLGCSKGGFAAMLLAVLLNRYCKDIEVRFCSFSPQTKLYPHNENLYFPSYHKLLEKTKGNRDLSVCLKQYGNVSEYINSDMLIGHIYYSEFNEPDYIEQHRIRSVNVKKHPLPFSFHGTVMPFTIDTQNEKEVSKLVEAVYMNARNEADLGKSLPVDKEILKKEILNTKIKKLSKVIFDIFYDK